MECTICKKELQPAGMSSTKDTYKVTGFCPTCGIYYDGENAVAVVKENKIIQL